jgi:hypothetical protein
MFATTSRRNQITNIVNVVENPNNPEELLLDLGLELCKTLGWEVGDTLDWVNNKDGSWILKKSVPTGNN